MLALLTDTCYLTSYDISYLFDCHAPKCCNNYFAHYYDILPNPTNERQNHNTVILLCLVTLMHLSADNKIVNKTYVKVRVQQNTGSTLRMKTHHKTACLNVVLF